MRHAYATTCHPLRSSRARWCVWHMCMCMACARAHLEQRVPVAHALRVVDATLYSQHKPHLVRVRARVRARVRVRGRVRVRVRAKEAALHSSAHATHLLVGTLLGQACLRTGVRLRSARSRQLLRTRHHRLRSGADGRSALVLRRTLVQARQGARRGQLPGGLLLGHIRCASLMGVGRWV